MVLQSRLPGGWESSNAHLGECDVDTPRETLIFQAICGCRPIASMEKGVKGGKLGRGVAGKITNVTRLRDLCVDDARHNL